MRWRMIIPAPAEQLAAFVCCAQFRALVSGDVADISLPTECAVEAGFTCAFAPG
jgi:hypothetical protein